MNKSLVTNLLAAAGCVIALWLDNALLLVASAFALSGALTNWLAIHMLFEKVPGLYGSGVIPLHFEEFKLGIRRLMMTQFFTEENIHRFLRQESSQGLELSPLLDRIDLAPAFDSLVKTIMESSFGGMLTMVGGAEALAPLKQPFIDNMRRSLKELTATEAFQSTVNEALQGETLMVDIQENIELIIEQRLDELTPELVKKIIEDMIARHLGWLVVWGGVFGAIIGLITGYLQSSGLFG